VVLGKDFYDLQIYSSEFLIDDNTLFFLVSDADKNICLFTYAPYSKFFFFSFPFLFYYIFIISILKIILFLYLFFMQKKKKKKKNKMFNLVMVKNY